MRRRSIALVLGGAAVLAIGGRYVMKRPAPGPPSAGGTASLHVFDDGRPAADVWVVFHDASGGVVATQRTNAEGIAKGRVEHGSMITVAHGAGVKGLVTVTAVEPGDRIVVGEEEDEGGPEATACTARITLPPNAPKAARYAVTLGVGATEVDPTKPLSLPVLARYLADGKFAVLAEARDERGVGIAFAHGWFGGCGTDAGQIDVGLAKWSTSYRKLARDAHGLEAPANLRTELAMLGAGGDRFYATPNFTVPEPLAQSRAEYKFFVAYDGNDRSVLEERAPLPTDTAIDLRARLLPRVSNARIEGNAPRPVVRWQTSSAAQADVVVVRLAWPATREHSWTFLLPPTAEPRLAVPSLPDELAPYRLDRSPLTPAVALLEASFFDGYADVKKKGLDALEEPPEGDTAIRFSTTGEIDF